MINHVCQISCAINRPPNRKILSSFINVHVVSINSISEGRLFHLVCINSSILSVPLDFSMYSWQQKDGRLQFVHHINIRLS